MGFDILINTLLKAMGYSKEEFDSGITKIKSELDTFTTRAIGTEQRVESIVINQEINHNKLLEIEKLLKQLVEKDSSKSEE